MKLFKILAFVLSLSILACNGQASKEIKNIDAPAFAEKIKNTPNPQILDVRTPEEYATDHISDAKNINWLGDSFVADVAKLDKTKPVFVYCKSGGRSAKATEKLNELGFTTIYELQGGFLKWDAAGLSKPLDKIVGLSSEQYKALLNTDKKVLIDFYAEWCAPCKKMAPYLAKMETELKDKVVIIRLNADENKTIMQELKIEELPTLLVYKNNEVQWKHTGFITEQDLRKQLN
ncbi:thioredoxin domain-containing protein [Flavobacterium muglaense]|uniref:Thioredoxin fold domain-containing protein n=1 Tax=Flavobacterium muglaense TaxID=2764716 RepID=A0A923MWV4_9FLAO|nr:thioredoxin domain-containing protein [Flavobacterium muglaense]MBC5837278.1 thioredoxin fold domain-containing protein [Flavobacterium muglaense]MBC5843798.1 thioredoxin fold domain-containing protein [Flavobacterium muglaense]